MSNNEKINLSQISSYNYYNNQIEIHLKPEALYPFYKNLIKDKGLIKAQNTYRDYLHYNISITLLKLAQVINVDQNINSIFIKSNLIKNIEEFLKYYGFKILETENVYYATMDRNFLLTNYSNLSIEDNNNDDKQMMVRLVRRI